MTISAIPALPPVAVQQASTPVQQVAKPAVAPQAAPVASADSDGDNDGSGAAGVNVANLNIKA